MLSKSLHLEKNGEVYLFVKDSEGCEILPYIQATELDSQFHGYCQQDVRLLDKRQTTVYYHNNSSSQTVNICTDSPQGKTNIFMCICKTGPWT